MDKHWENDLISEILKQLKDNIFLFICNSCGTYVFNSNNIISLYVINDKEFGYVLQYDQTNEKLFKLSKEIATKDDMLQQTDCAYFKLTCANCQNALGSKIILATQDKLFLSGNIVIKNDSVTSIKHSKYSLSRTKLRLSIDKVLKNSHLNSIKELRTQINEGIEILNKKLSIIGNDKEIISNLPKLQDECEDSNKVFEYLKYYINTFENSTNQ